MAVLVVSVDTVGRMIAEQISGIGEGALGLLLIVLKVLVVAAWLECWAVGSCVGCGINLWFWVVVVVHWCWKSMLTGVGVVADCSCGG